MKFLCTAALAALVATLGVPTPADAAAPLVVSSSASATSENSATVRGELQSAGDAARPWALVRLYWGAADGGADPAAWERATRPVWHGVGPLQVDLPAVRPGHEYFCRLYATNDAGEAWSDVMSFFTHGLVHRWSFNDGTMKRVGGCD